MIIISFKAFEFWIWWEKSIIYPIYEKHISAEPFFTFYQYFQRRVLFENILVIFGYSFAIPSINNAFMDWLYHPLQLSHTSRTTLEIPPR